MCGGTHGSRPTGHFCRAGPACPAGGAMQGRSAGGGHPALRTVTRTLVEWGVGDAAPYGGVAGSACVERGRGRTPPLRVRCKEVPAAGRCGHRPLRRYDKKCLRGIPQSASLTAPRRGRGLRIATTGVRTGFAMTMQCVTGHMGPALQAQILYLFMCKTNQNTDHFRRNKT